MGVVLLPNAKQQFEDGNGVPLAAGSVYMYVPNSSPPVFATTWQDIGQMAENTNPIVLDADGRCIIWGSGIYRQVVYDALGNLVWDQLTSDGLSAVVGVTQQFALPVFIEDKPSDGEIFPVVNIPWNSLLPAGLTGSIFTLEVNPAATTVWTLTKNGSSFATISFNTSGVPTVTAAALVSFAPPDKLRFVSQATADATAAGFAATLVFTTVP